MVETTLSLAGGTFVLLVRLLFLSPAAGDAASRAPERRTAEMEIKYEFVTGEVLKIEVEDA